ncbi:MAG: tetratricopeptide repeat protein [Lacunisphaera sp.]|nr:tetratricopeptide repeat protein [Lacunisphaera sp.]
MDLGKFDPAQFDPAAPAYRRKLWVRLASPGGAVRVVFLWRRIFLVLLILAVAAWLAAAAAAFVFVRVRHDFAGASYLNLVLPQRWPLHRQALGRHYLARGQAALAAGDYVDAAQFYAAGVARVPGDLPARRQLAIIYLRFGQTAAGLNLLVAGLDAARDNLDYLKLTFGLLDELKEDARILELGQKLLPARPDEILPHQFLALQAAQAQYQSGNYDGAEQTLAAWRLERSLEGQLLLARCDWERGYPDLAILRLEQQRERFSDRDELPLQLIRFYRDLGRTDQALNEALIRHSADPFSPGPRVDLLYAWHRHNDGPRLARELESYLRDFSADAAAVTLLGWFAADIGDAALAQRLLALAQTQHFRPESLELVLVQALIVQDRYQDALAAAEAALARRQPVDDGFTSVLSGLRALACFGAGDPANGEANLQAFLVRRHLRASDALLLARRLHGIGARVQALQVLTTAVRADPLNQATLSELVHLETVAGNVAALEEFLPRLLAMRKPARAILQEAYLRLDDATPARAVLRQSIRAAVEKSSATPEPTP